MTKPFDPYHQWLSIPPEEQPGNFYRLLGVKVGENDLGVIQSAADRQMSHVRSFATGPRGAIAQRVLNELAGARTMLLDPPRKSAYDAMLRAATADAAQAPGAAGQPAPAETAAVPQGKPFGDYLVLHPISQGASGTVYKAQRQSDGLIVSLRIIPKKLTSSPEFLKRLKREYELTKNLQHPHVVASYELGEVQGQPYLAFEYVGGADLGRVVAEHGPLQLGAATEILRSILLGLDCLHRKGIVHRNLKPQNILVNVHGAVKIANLTLALEDDARAFLGGHDMNLTATGEVLGSPEFIAPEQAMDSHAVDGRADLYALGCTVVHLLTGRPPYAGKNAMQLLAAHQSAPIPKLSQLRPDTPPWLDDLAQALLAKKPLERPASAQAVLERLPGQVEKRSQNVIVIVAAAVIAVILFLVLLIILNR